MLDKQKIKVNTIYAKIVCPCAVIDCDIADTMFQQSACSRWLRGQRVSVVADYMETMLTKSLVTPTPGPMVHVTLNE